MNQMFCLLYFFFWCDTKTVKKKRIQKPIKKPKTFLQRIDEGGRGFVLGVKRKDPRMSSFFGVWTEKSCPSPSFFFGSWWLGSGSDCVACVARKRCRGCVVKGSEGGNEKRRQIRFSVGKLFVWQSVCAMLFALS